MKFRSVNQKLNRSAEERERIKAIREKFQAERPTEEQLVQTGEYTGPVPLGAYLEVKEMLQRLKKERERAGLSLVDVSERTGMDKAAISKLENGRQPNPTVDTLARYAWALGKRIVWSFTDVPEGAMKGTHKSGNTGASATGKAP